MPKILKLLLFIVLCAISYWIIEFNHLDNFIKIILPFKLFAIFVAGLMYASFVTTPLSIASFYLLALHTNPLLLALIGGVGAAVGDVLLIHLLRLLKKDLPRFSTKGLVHDIKKLLHSVNLHFVALTLGILIIASPLPDEIGLILLGATKLPDYKIFLISAVLNAIGIYLILIPLEILK